MKCVNKVLPVCLIVLGLICTGCKPSSTTAPLEQNKALVRRGEEMIVKQDWAAFMELHAPNLIYHGTGNPEPQTREEMIQSFRSMYTAFPGFSLTIEDTIAEGDKVVIRETFRGTNKGDIKELGISATGKEVTVSVTTIFRIADGKIAEAWEAYDMMSVMQQLGVMPPGE